MASRMSRPSTACSFPASGPERASVVSVASQNVKRSLDERHGGSGSRGPPELRDMRLPPAARLPLTPARLRAAVGEAPRQILGVGRPPLRRLLQAGEDGAFQAFGDGKRGPARRRHRSVLDVLERYLQRAVALED